MKFFFWKRARKPDRRVSTEDILEKLQLIKAKLSRRVKELNSRYRELFEQVVKAYVKAYMEKDRERAAIYAEELAELRKMLRRLTHASLLLEGTIYRIEAVKDLSDAGQIMTPLKSVLTIASEELRGIAPTASEGLNELIDSIEDFSINVGQLSDSMTSSPELSDEARKILEEASAIASQRNREKASG